jgi:hypothetical protein
MPSCDGMRRHASSSFFSSACFWRERANSCSNMRRFVGGVSQKSPASQHLARGAQIDVKIDHLVFFGPGRSTIGDQG